MININISIDLSIATSKLEKNLNLLNNFLQNKNMNEDVCINTITKDTVYNKDDNYKEIKNDLFDEDEFQRSIQNYIDNNKIEFNPNGGEQ